MSKNYQMYARAAMQLKKGWTRKVLVSPDGAKMCFNGAVMDASGLAEDLNPEVIAEIDSELLKYRLYRILKRHVGVTKFGHTLQAYEVIEAWNDMPWRRQKTVVQSLERLSRRLETDWLRQEHVRLTEEVEQLRTRVAQLESRVSQLESENRGLRRLTNSYALRADRKELAGLEAELNQTWDQLSKLPAFSA